MKTKFSITRVVSRDIATDYFQALRNMFGMRLRGYEDRINKTTEELIKLVEMKYKRIDWFRFSVNPIVKGAVMITIYGEGSNE